MGVWRPEVLAPPGADVPAWLRADGLEREQAEAMLAAIATALAEGALRTYLHAYGPAPREQFQRWFGMTS
ncbi:MAG TPA: hypothetical protein VKA57_03375, partial [Solirubrobacteraceae bacterium]|nr:hypothetical protein [Solirubrobacteraceae bacterium]